MQKAKELRSTYDYIIHDVFTGGAEPIDLFTREFIMGLSDLLRSDGVVAIVRAPKINLSAAKLGLQTSRTTPATSSFPSPRQSSAPYNPSSPNAACIANHHSPPLLSRRTTPTWSCSAGNPQQSSHSENPSKQIFWAAQQDDNISSRNTKYLQAISKSVGSRRGRYSGEARSVVRCRCLLWLVLLGIGIL